MPLQELQTNNMQPAYAFAVLKAEHLSHLPLSSQGGIHSF